MEAGGLHVDSGGITVRSGGMIVDGGIRLRSGTLTIDTDDAPSDAGSVELSWVHKQMQA